jgi:hypothetical protein
MPRSLPDMPTFSDDRDRAGRHPFVYFEYKLFSLAESRFRFTAELSQDHYRMHRIEQCAASVRT